MVQHGLRQNENGLEGLAPESFSFNLMPSAPKNKCFITMKSPGGILANVMRHRCSEEVLHDCPHW